MKESLPDYIVNCMLAAGYDDIKIISAMDVTDSEGNSISIIENFIEKDLKEILTIAIITFQNLHCHLNFHLDIDYEFVILSMQSRKCIVLASAIRATF